MGIKTYNPYTPSRRNMTGSDFAEITKKKPEKSLLVSLQKKSGRNDDIGLLTVRIADQSDICRPVGIVLNADYSCRDPVLPIPLEINNSIFPPGAAAAVPAGDFTLIVTAGFFLQGNQQ